MEKDTAIDSNCTYVTYMVPSLSKSSPVIRQGVFRDND